MLKKTMIILSVLYFSTNSFAMEKDKLMHFSVSTSIGLFSELAIDDPLKSIALCSSVGLAKEVYDQIDYNGFSKKDLLYDALGCGLGVFTGNRLKFHFSNKDFLVSYNYDF